MPFVHTLSVAAAMFVLAAFPDATLPSQHMLIASAQAQETSAAGQFVSKLGDDVIQILKNDPYDARKQKLREVFTRSFDVGAMAQFAAGSYWRRADDNQKREYLKLFGQYVASLYANKFGDYSGQNFKVTGERASGDADIAVESTIVQGQKPPVKVDFRVRKSSDGFKIVDVYVEGISLLITKRDEFTTVLSREGMNGLLQRLRSTAQG
jgi:phospholipid transport system substrate-binding protein